MKIVKFKILSFYSLFISAILYLLGYSTSCTKEYGSPQPMYGVFATKYIVNGTITTDDSLNQPIQNIKVTMLNNVSTSNSTGNYHAESQEFSQNNTYPLKFEDVDGTANGEYLSKDTTVTFQNNITEINLNIKLKPK
ncbi:MAG: hypothetical protein A2X08_07780 [Bacteroidetes bacterium GWA2_32_17]|nr:MAG: hypothetical protein A2X08_07780 [Bacteroidetes bacterium GWA2_32_17]